MFQVNAQCLVEGSACSSWIFWFKGRTVLSWEEPEVNLPVKQSGTCAQWERDPEHGHVINLALLITPKEGD